MPYWLHKFAVGYGKFLTAETGPANIPALLWILILCPTALLVAFVLWLPVHQAMQHGVPLDGYIHTYDKHGNPETDSVRSIVTFSDMTVVICVPLLLSAAAYLFGWFGQSDKR